MIENPMYTADPPEPDHLIENLEDLCHYLSADEPRQLNWRIYKATACGASISLYLKDGTAIHNGDDAWEKLPMDTEIRGFTIQTIVEGSDATVDSEEFELPVHESEVDKWIAEMEGEADVLWQDANNPLCECGHPSDKHRWDDDPRFEKGFAVKGFECQEEGCACKELKEMHAF